MRKKAVEKERMVFYLFRPILFLKSGYLKKNKIKKSTINNEYD